MKAHEATEIFPMMSSSDLGRLADDIGKRGLLMPIICDESGLILDGRNRLEACRQAGVEPRFETKNINGGSVAEFVWSLNFERRQMTKTEKVMAAARYAVALKKEAQARQGFGSATYTANLAVNADLGQSATKAAAQFGVSERTVRRGIAILKHGTPAQIASAEKGELTVSGMAIVVKKATAAKPAISEAAAPVPPARPTRRGRPRQRMCYPVPDGKTLESVCREAMAQIEAGSTLESVAKALNFPAEPFRQIQYMIRLIDYAGISDEDRQTVREALATVNSERTVTEPYQRVAPIVQLLWGTQRRGWKWQSLDQLAQRRFSDFDRALSTVVVPSESIHLVDIPYLTAQQREYALKQIDAAMAGLRTFQQRLTAKGYTR